MANSDNITDGSSGRHGRYLLSVGTIFISVFVTLFGLLFITFVIGRLMPIDPVLAIIGERASEQTYQQVYRELGLDKPIWTQFAIYVSNVLQGELGTSVITARPVLDDIIRVFPATLELACLGILIGVTIGIPAGVWASVNRGRWPDQLVRIIGLVGYSMPIFWLGIMALVLFYNQLGWVGGPGRINVFLDDIVPNVTGVITIDAILANNWEVFNNALTHLVLPASLLGYYSLAYIARMTRSLMLEQLSQEYITAARVKGVAWPRIVWRHAFANILPPLITVVALSFASLLEGSVLTETVFSWPGLGRYLTKALLAADMNAVMGGTFVVGVIFIGVNLLSDIAYKIVDPRTRR